MITYTHVWELIELLSFAKPIDALESDNHYDENDLLELEISHIAAWEAARVALQRYGRVVACYSFVFHERALLLKLRLPKETIQLVCACYTREKRARQKHYRRRR